MRKSRIQRILESPKACEEAFDIEIDAQKVINLTDFLVSAAISGKDEYVRLPTWLAAAAILVMSRKVSRPQGGQRSDWRTVQRKKQVLRIRKRRPVGDEIIIWARARMHEIKDEAKRRHRPLTMSEARERAAKEAWQKFNRRLTQSQIVDRMQRPGRYAPRESQPRWTRVQKDGRRFR